MSVGAKWRYPPCSATICASASAGARFERRDGERYKIIDLRLENAEIHSLYDALEPARFKDPVYEGRSTAA